MCWNSIKFFSGPVCFVFFNSQLVEKNGGVGQGEAVGWPGGGKCPCEVNGGTFLVEGGPSCMFSCGHVPLQGAGMEQAQN